MYMALNSNCIGVLWISSQPFYCITADSEPGTAWSSAVVQGSRLDV